MKIQIRDKAFNLLAERERSTKSKTPTTFIHKIRRIGDKPALGTTLKGAELLKLYGTQALILPAFTLVL